MKRAQRSNRPGEFTMPLDAVRSKDLPRLGGKASHLREMLAAGLPVPGGFVVTTDACKRFLQSEPATADWLKDLDECGPEDSLNVRAAAKETMRRLDAISIPDEIALAIKNAMASGSAAAWAVRSSATVEDSAAASYAGQYDSFLNVRGAGAVTAAVKRCWISLFSERAISYRLQNRIPAGRIQMAVLVQQFINAGTAGVMFTADPAGDDSNCILMEAAFGLGEAVVQGKVTPDRLKVSRSTLRVLWRESGWKRMRVVAADNGVREELLSKEEGNPPALNDEMAVALAELGLKAERLFEAPQDIEWAQHAGKLFLLQSRPITRNAPVKAREDRQVWSNWNAGEIAPDVMTPITWSLVQSLAEGTAFRSVFRLLGADVRRAPLLGLVAGRLYFNANTAMAALKPFSFLLAGATDLFQAVGGGPAEAYRRTLAIPPGDLPDLGFRWPKYILSWPRILFDLLTHLPGHGEAWAARFKVRTDELVQMNVEAMSTPELARLGSEILWQPFRDVDLLYLAMPAMVLPLLQKAFRHWLGEDLAFGFQLFSALGGMPTAEAGLGLWRLATLAHANAEIGSAVGSEDAWPQVCTRLQRTESGRKFLAAWNDFMLEHGHHCRGELELFNARWSETPGYILGLVRGYLHAIGRSNPLDNQRRLAIERERLTEQCRQRLKNPVKRWIFSWSLHHAQKLAVFREKLKSQGIRQIAFARRLLLTLGQRLHKQAILSRNDDVLFLEISELEPVTTGNASFNWRERIEVRRREYEGNLKLSPPPLVIGKFHPGTDTGAMANVDAGLLTGIPASPGIVNGTARVILRADSRQRVLPGEILVAPFTDPAWSPYFVVAAGLIVEQGGILSHGSIVAREYGLPAVTNVSSATGVIRTGDRVQVNGNSGQVTILARASDRTSESPRSTESLE